MILAVLGVPVAEMTKSIKYQEAGLANFAKGMEKLAKILHENFVQAWTMTLMKFAVIKGNVMTNQKIALFIFDMLIVVICVTGLLLILGAIDEYDREQEIKQQERIAANKSNDESLRRSEWVLLLNKGEQTTTFKAEMK
jgi:hypothetical protein